MSTPHPVTSRARTLRPFHTPVRGSVFASRRAATLARGPSELTLRREPDNPADPWAVAVWAEQDGVPWRVGYLERAVAARLAERDERELRALRVTFAGWWEEPGGRWQRPVVRVAAAGDVPPARPRGLRALPPFAHRGTARSA